MFRKLIDSMFSKAVESVLGVGEDPIDYKSVDTSLGVMSPEEALKKADHILKEENANLSLQDSSVFTANPSLSENLQNGHRQWLITFLYRKKDGRMLEEHEIDEYLWVTVDDETGEVGDKIFARPTLKNQN